MFRPFKLKRRKNNNNLNKTKEPNNNLNKTKEPKRKPDFDSERLIKKISNNKIEYDLYTEYLHNKSIWITGRGYREYNFYFKRILNESIFDYINKKIKNRSNSLNRSKFSILEDGIGKGLFFKDLQYKFKDKLNKLSFDAVTLNKDEINSSVLKHTNLYLGDIEKIKFTKKYDLIFSVYGSISYTMFKKDVLLKYINSLKKDGILLLGYDDLYTNRENSDKFINNLKVSLKKRGFLLEFKKSENHFSDFKYDLPEGMFLIKKI